MQNFGAAIVQPFRERSVVALGILVEQPADIRFGHCRGCFAEAEPRQLQARAVIIVGVGVAGLRERRDRAVAVAEPVADGAKREPGRGEVRRELHRLRQDIGRRGKVAARGKLDRRLVAPVGNQIAGRHKEWAGVGHSRVISGPSGAESPQSITPDFVILQSHRGAA